jgi:hypothetical protein
VRVRLWLVLSFALALANVFGPYHCLSRALVADNQHYFFIAERAASGVPPHISQVDPKTMLGPMVTALAIKAGRIAGIEDIAAARLVSALVAALSVSLVWWIAWRLSGDPWAAHLAALALLGTWGFMHEAAVGARPKVFLVFFMVAAHAAAIARRPVLAGLASAAAFLSWQPGALVGAALFVGIVLEGRRRRDAALFAAAVAAAVALYEGWFAWQGIVGVQLYQSFVLPTLTDHRIPLLSHTVPLLLSGGRRAWPGATWIALACLPVLAWVWLRVLLAPRASLQDARRGNDFVALILALHLGLAWTFYDNQAHPDLLLVQPYLAIVAGLAVACVARRLAEGADPNVSRAFLATALTGVVLAVWGGSASDRLSAGGLAPQQALSRTVEQLARAYGGVWAVGCTHLLAFVHRDNWTPYGFFFDDVNAELALEEDWKPLRGGEMPPIILVSRGFYPGAEQWLTGGYVGITSEQFREQGVRVLRRIDLGPPVEDTSASNPAAAKRVKPKREAASKSRPRGGARHE